MSISRDDRFVCTKDDVPQIRVFDADISQNHQNPRILPGNSTLAAVAQKKGCLMVFEICRSQRPSIGRLAMSPLLTMPPESRKAAESQHQTQEESHSVYFQSPLMGT